MSEEQTEKIHLTIDGRQIIVNKGTTVHDAAKSLGVEVPIFCYHDRMPPFGACRICLVEVEGNPKLQTSCTLQAQEGMKVNTTSALALKGRSEIMELLLINHPLDCPVCDRAGECPLQEHAMHHGCGKSKFFEEKRHFEKPVERGPLLMLDRERCIACARCTRFGDLIAGDHALELIHRGYKTEVGTPDDGPAKSKFIGNTIMICPVGALTSRAYRFRARPWDNETTESSCTLCPVGCSFNIDKRDGEVMRIRSKENKKVNDIWLCDKGWFGFEFSSHLERLKTPLAKKNGRLTEISWDEAFSLAAEKISGAKQGEKIAGIGGKSLTVEENYLFQKFIREACCSNHIDYRVGDSLFSLEEEGLPAGMETSLENLETLSHIVLLGIDLTEEFPLLWLRMKQAINKGAKVLFIGHCAPEIASQLSQVILHPPGEEIATWKAHVSSFCTSSEPKRAACFIGRQYLSLENRRQLLSQLLQLRQDIGSLEINILEGSGNSVGARFAGVHPELLPGQKTSKTAGLNTVEILERAASGELEILYVAGANLAERVSRKLWDLAKSKLNFLVVQDLFLTETAKQADLVLPTLSFLEKEGTFMNIEGRFLPIRPGKEIPKNVYSDAEIFIKLAKKLKHPLEMDSDFLKQIHGEKRHVPYPKSLSASHGSTDIQANGMFRVTFSKKLFDQGVRMRHNTHLKKMIEPFYASIHPEDAKMHHMSEGDHIRIKIEQNTASFQVSLNHKVARKTLVLPLGISESPAYELAPKLLAGVFATIWKEE